MSQRPSVKWSEKDRKLVISGIEREIKRLERQALDFTDDRIWLEIFACDNWYRRRSLEKIKIVIMVADESILEKYRNLLERFVT